MAAGTGRAQHRCQDQRRLALHHMRPAVFRHLSRLGCQPFQGEDPLLVRVSFRGFLRFIDT